MNVPLIVISYILIIFGVVMFFRRQSPKSKFDSMGQSQLPGLSRDSVIIFFAPWCGHCVRAKPEFEKAKRGGRGDIHLIDATDPDNKQLVEKYGIRSFPTIMKIDGTTYDGPRDSEKILEFKDSK